MRGAVREVVAVCERCGSDDVRVARDETERQLFWKTRKAAFPAMGRISPNYFVQDGVIPRTRLPEVLEAIDALAEEYGMVVANVFHAGDGNLHPLVCFDGRNEGEAERAEELSGGSSTRAWRPAARSPASTGSAWTRRSTCRRCSGTPTWTRSSGCAARGTRPGWRTPAR
jgi:FAD/FMN-containing dehydrogenase